MPPSITAPAPSDTPAVVVPISVLTQCPSCRRRTNWPAAAVGLTVRCLGCGTRLHVDLGSDDDARPTCKWCSGPLPRQNGSTYCSDPCRTEGRNAQRRAAAGTR